MHTFISTWVIHKCTFSTVLTESCPFVSLKLFHKDHFVFFETKETKTKAIKCVCVHNPYKSMYNIIDSPWINWS